MSESTRIIHHVNNPKHCFCSLKLASGEKIIIQIATKPIHSIKVQKLKMGGLVFGSTIWEYDAQMAGSNQEYFNNFGKMFADEMAFVGVYDDPTPQHQLDIVIGVLIHCASIDHVRHALLDHQRLTHSVKGDVAEKLKIK